ncbi:glycine-rich RNA-binding protein [Striga asiatica]|uniref:Glycine-rich RNA-binding protein n=1 Tax=Striga asiatica TaxID=4170 RepID=A0A5A7QJ08_STRAF|nr:glycine-rich RNA-binding protein [Striga asiatica]
MRRRRWCRSSVEQWFRERTEFDWWGVGKMIVDPRLRISWSHLSNFSEVIIIIDRETGISRGFRFVTFSDEKAMRDAIDAMNSQELDGRNITVNEARSRGGDGGGGFRGGLIIIASFEYGFCIGRCCSRAAMTGGERTPAAIRRGCRPRMFTEDMFVELAID